MKILITMPHIFKPVENSPYSSQTESKRKTKEKALLNATVENINRHSENYWIHASLGNKKPVITRQQKTDMGVDLTIQIHTHSSYTLTDSLPSTKGLDIVKYSMENISEMPLIASKGALEQANSYDLIGYMEDDILIEDREFFSKIKSLVQITGGDYAFLPHRYERINNHGDVILSGDPDGGRPDLFWDTGETIQIEWPLGIKNFYRATNPHSGCYFLTQTQAKMVHEYWRKVNWEATFQLSGPLEQAGSGLLLPVLKIMKPIPSHYRFLSVLHQDELWRRHGMESELKKWN